MVTGDAENTAVGGWIILQLYRGSTAIGKKVHVESSAGSENIPYALTVIDAPSAGTYTYALKTASAAAAGTFNFGETDGPVITALELTGGVGPTGPAGATVELTDSTSTTSSTIAASATAVKSASDLAGTKAAVGATTPSATNTTSSAGSSSEASRADHVHQTGSHTHEALMPTGSVAMWMTATAPSGWLFLNGQTISQATYPALAAVFGVGSGTFALPDMRDRFAAGRSDTALGWANSSGTFGPNAANIHTHTTNIAHGHADNFSIPNHLSHTHSVNPPATDTGGPSATFTRGNSGTLVSVASNAHDHSVDIASFTSGGGSTTQTHEISGSVTALGATSVTSSDGSLSPKSTLLNFIIKT
jgi:microcystin-dependent protein